MFFALKFMAGRSELSLEINLDKTKIQTITDCPYGQLLLTIVVDMLFVLDTFTYFGSSQAVAD